MTTPEQIAACAAHEDYTILPARYAKGKMIIRVTSRGPFKTRAACLAGAKGIGGKWVHRSGGYTVSPSAARRFVDLYAKGYDASPFNGELIAPAGKVES